MLSSSISTGKVLAAVSGGPDSTALLIALHESGHDVVVAHYDHALRDGSSDAARQVAELCARLVVRLITERRTEAMPKGSLQAAARKLRYAFLDRARVEAAAEVVALAHTADDVVEGVVLHMLRGCGLAGFRGMPARRGHFIRPFLNVWRKDVREYLQVRAIVAHEDPANLDPRFARVRVRHLILPALEHDRPGIGRRFHSAAGAAMRLHEAASTAAAGPTTREELRSLPEPVAAEALKLLYVRAGGPDPGLSRAHIAAMLRVAGRARGGGGGGGPGGVGWCVVWGGVAGGGA